MHYESGSSSVQQSLSQAPNLEKFRSRHADWLARQPAWGTPELAARSRPSGALRILVVEDQVPHVRCGGGYPRANALVRDRR